MAPKYTLSDSESESETDAPTTPSDEVLEKSLRDEVAAIFKSANMKELTVKRVRLAAEKKLGLEEGFFKSTGNWKSRSEQIIKDEVDVQDNAPPETKAQPAKSQPAAPSRPNKTAPSKRSKGETASKPRKRQKTQTPVSELEDDEDEADPSDDESEEEVAKSKKRSRASAEETVKPTSAKVESPEAADSDENDGKAPKVPQDDSESEMSVVLDEEPKPAPKRQKSAETSSKKEKKPACKTAKGKEEGLDPDQADIKRLQGWLVKCGIRKMWWRELQPYETPKAKIRHLKEMLEEVGMKGRYSLEKARQIRDERELKADLEQIQQGAKQWGTKSADEGSDGQPRRRAAARGRQALAFLDSEGEESD